MDIKDNVKLVTIKGKVFILFDDVVAVPAWKLRELFLRTYDAWKKAKREPK